MPSGHWDFIHLGRRIRVQEGPERRTIALVGREWTEPRVVVYLHSKEWICTDWTEPVKERKVAVLTAADDVAERERLAEEAKARLGISEFHVSGSLRSAWYEAQRRDGSLAGILRKTEHRSVCLRRRWTLGERGSVSSWTSCQSCCCSNWDRWSQWFDVAPGVLQPGALWNFRCT